MMQLLLQEMVMPVFWRILLKWTDLDENEPVKNLSFFKMTPCLNTSKQRERI